MIAEIESTNQGVSEAPQITYIDYSELHASPTNPREHFEPLQLQELSENVEERGVIMPLLGRASKTEPGKIEIVAGERRFRATGMALERVAAAEDTAKYAALFRLPVIVKDLDDKTVLELQLIENLQRQDLTPLEEARGYQRLLDLEGGEYTPQKIALKVGKKLPVVLMKLRMLRAPKLLQEALEQGLVSERHLSLVATLPGDKARQQCAKEVIRGEYDHRQDRNVPLSVRETVVIINRDYRASLKKVPWSLDDAELVKTAGPCGNCPHFAKHAAEQDEELAAELGNGRGQTDPLTCMNPECWKQKQEAVMKQMKAAAKEGQVKVLTAAEQEKVLGYGGHLQSNSKLVKLDDKLPYEIVGHYDEKKSPTWREVTSGLLPEGVLVVGNVEKVGIIELVDRKVAIEAAKGHAKHGKLFQQLRASGKKELTDSEKKQREKQLFDNKVELRMKHVLLTHLADVALTKGMDADAGLVQLEVVMIEAGMDGCRLIAEWLKLEVKAEGKQPLSQVHYRDAVIEHIKARGSGKAEIDVFILIAGIAKWLKVYGAKCSIMKPVMDFYGFDHKTIEALAKAEVQAEMKAKADKAKPKLKSKGRDLEPAAATEKANAQVATAEIIKQGDKERKKAPSRKRGVGILGGMPQQQSALEKAKGLWEDMMAADIEVSRPNKLGFFEKYEGFTFSLNEEIYFSVLLSKDKDGLWHEGYDYEFVDLGGDEFPNNKGRFFEREKAIGAAVSEILKDLTEELEAARAGRYLEQMNQLKDVLLELQKLAYPEKYEQIDQRPENSEPTPALDGAANEEAKNWTVEQKARALNAGTHDLAALIGVKPNRKDKEALRAWDAERYRVRTAAAKLK